MKILVAHNKYQYSGGEDVVVDAEVSLLRSYGHEVEVYQRHNSELKSLPEVTAALSTIWSHQSVRGIEHICAAFQPDVIHTHNTFPLISPAVYWMAARQKIPLVQTLHNFRLICPQANFLYHGKVCEDCIAKLPWRAVTRKCYRHSFMQSAVSATMLATHRAIGTYANKVTRYIALNEFCRNKFIESGVPAERLRVKPNFVICKSRPSWQGRKGGLFVGRLSAEKGLDVLADAVQKTGISSFKVVGSGPLESFVKEVFGNNYLGFKQADEIFDLLSSSSYLVAPSTCYETFGLVAVEAFACGTPVIASRHGSLGEIVRDGVTGILFSPGNAAELAVKIAWAESHPEEMLTMGKAAHAEYNEKYTSVRNYDILISIYRDAIAAINGEDYGT